MQNINKLLMAALVLAIAATGVILPAATTVAAQKETSRILIQNVNIFNGMSPELSNGMSVLIEGNKIAQIAKSIEAPAGAMVIEGGGRTLMPGLIDAHVHLVWNVPVSLIFTAPQDYLNALTLKEGERPPCYGATPPSATSPDRSSVSSERLMRMFIRGRVFTLPGPALV
jgi:hypothetical protein